MNNLIHYIEFDTSSPNSVLPFMLCAGNYTFSHGYKEFAKFRDIGVVVYRHVSKTYNILIVDVDADGRKYSYTCPYSLHAHHIIKDAERKLAYPILPECGWEDYAYYIDSKKYLIPVIQTSRGSVKIIAEEDFLCGFYVSDLFTQQARFLMHNDTPFIIQVKSNKKYLYYHINSYVKERSVQRYGNKGYYIHLDFHSPIKEPLSQLYIGEHLK